MDIESSRIIGMPQVGCSAKGQDVHFSFKLQNGEMRSFVCAYEKLGEFMARFVKGADLAARKRKEQGSQPQDREPEHVQELQSIEFTMSEDLSALVLELKTKQNWSIHVRTPLDVIGRLSDSLYAYSERLAAKSADG